MYSFSTLEHSLSETCVLGVSPLLHSTFLKIYTDHTGRFPITFSRGYKYIMIAYDYDSNNILADPIKSRTSLHIKDAYQKLRKLLCSRGLTPMTHVLDNECSKVLKEYMEEENETFQLVPPRLHQRNAAERSIQNFKNHFIAGMVSTHKDTPLHLWCRLLPQSIVTQTCCGHPE